MAPETRSARLKKIGSYAAFVAFSFVLGLFLTFPYDALKTRIQTEADLAGFYVRMGSLGPGFFGVTAHNIEISKKATGTEDKPPGALTVKSVSVRPSLFPLGVSISANALGGTVKAAIGGLSDTVVRADFDDLDLSQGNLKAFTGIDMSGKAKGEVSLDIPKSGSGKNAEPDLSLASGSIQWNLNGVTINGGTVKIPIPMYGPEPTPVDLPKIGLGDIEAKVKFDKGQGTLERFSGRGQGIELGGSGTLKLAKKMDYVEPNLDLRFKTDPEFVKSLGPYGAALSVVRADAKDPNWRAGKLTGFLGRPNFR